MMRASTISLSLFCCTVSILSIPAHALPPTNDRTSARRLVPGAQPEPDTGHRAPGTIAWQTSLPAAKAKAARSGKPLLLLHLHLFGKLNEEFC